MSVTSDHPGLHTFNQVHPRRLTASIEAVQWDSVAAREAVARICQEAAWRCQRVMPCIPLGNSPDGPAQAGNERTSSTLSRRLGDSDLPLVTTLLRDDQ